MRLAVTNVLFICNANIVRSFMAERIFNGRLERLSINGVSASSAGLLDMNGAAADTTARRILAEHGIDDEGHVSRLLTEEILREADLVLTMEMSQLQKIETQYPEFAGGLKVLKSYLPDYDIHQGDIADPYRRSLFHYRLCFAEISLSVEALIKCI